METAAISKLKASLSEYLSKVKAGEDVIITERGKPIARISPVDRDACGIPTHLLTLERAGLVKIGKGGIPKEVWRLPRPKDKNGAALAALLKEREKSR